MYKIKLNEKEYEVISSQENVFAIGENREDSISVYLSEKENKNKEEITELIGTNVKAEILDDTKVIASIDESYRLQELSRNLLSGNGFTIRFIKSV